MTPHCSLTGKHMTPSPSDLASQANMSKSRSAGLPSTTERRWSEGTRPARCSTSHRHTTPLHAGPSKVTVTSHGEPRPRSTPVSAVSLLQLNPSSPSLFAPPLISPAPATPPPRKCPTSAPSTLPSSAPWYVEMQMQLERRLTRANAGLHERYCLHLYVTEGSGRGNGEC